ncbi:MAG: M81 family metallopeptidase [Hyphomicrobiaceae bacterium]|nr:M81 family metallopeptidase [Hyphomicrobiaceae bacterium]
MHLFTASLGTETNTFSPIPTGRRLFAETALVRGGAYGAAPNLFALPMIEFRDRARARGWRVTESLCTFAMPAGTTVQRVYEAFRDEILVDLAKAMPVDAVLLSLHGAMVAEATESCETDLVQRIRAVVGPVVPIGAELDLHCHLTDELVAAASAIVIFKEYPHVDVRERAGELFDIVAAAAEGRAAPRMALFDCRMLGLYPTTVEPMASFLRKIRGLEGRDGVLSISIAHGFPWGDVSEAGTRVLLITDGAKADGPGLARALGLELRELRPHIEAPWLPLDVALERAMAAPAGPIVLADMADNAGGGAPSDSTFVLRAMLDRGMSDAAVGCVWDPGAVALAFEAGEGARLNVRVGGKLGPMSGDPIDLDATVTRVVRDAVQDGLAGKVGMGDSAAIRAGGIDIVLNSWRTQVFTPSAFTSVGIDPAAKRYVVVKSMNHFRAGFEPIAKAILYAAAPGAIDFDYTRIGYTRLRRPIYPLDTHAWADT